MHIRSILAIARKDALDILLNKATLTLLLTPIFLAVLFVVIGALLGSHTTNALVYNPGKSGVEQIISSAFSDIKITYANSPGDVEGSQVGNVQSQLLLRALTDYARSVANPQPPASITVATVNPPSPANNALQDIGQVYSTAILLSSFLVGTSLVPGLLAEEKEKKTLRMLMVSPASFSDVVAAKLLVGLVYQLLLAMVALGIKGGYTGEVPLVLLFVLLGSCFSVSLGLLIGSIFQTDRHGRILRDDILHLYPADFLCGAICSVAGEQSVYAANQGVADLLHSRWGCQCNTGPGYFQCYPVGCECDPR